MSEYQSVYVCVSLGVQVCVHGTWLSIEWIEKWKRIAVQLLLSLSLSLSLARSYSFSEMGKSGRTCLAAPKGVSRDADARGTEEERGERRRCACG